MKITVLGSGSAYGTPMIFNQWVNADRQNAKNQRTRASIFIEEGASKILVDAGPELRLQINRQGISDFQAVFLTHGHYDHIGGIPELPRASKLLGHKLDIYASAETLNEIKTCYAYLFKGGEKESVGLCWHEMPDSGEITIADLKFKVFTVPHHHLHPSAFRCGDFSYITDWEGLSAEAAKIIDGSKLLLAECNNGMSPETNGHSSWPQIVERLSELKIERKVLGHLSARVDYETFSRQLPTDVTVAYDGMELKL